MKITFVKACSCQSPAATNRIVTKVNWALETGVRLTATFHSGPSCLACDEPWVKREEEHGEDRQQSHD